MSQTVKEVLQSLVDDGLVQTDKIGSSNCAFTEQSLCFIIAYMRSAHPYSLLELSLSARGSGASSLRPLASELN